MSLSAAQNPQRRAVPAGVDTGGRTYTPLQLEYPHRSWCFSDEERGALAKAECSLELAINDLARAVADFEATGCRPGWVKESKRLRGALDRLRAKVRVELDS